jgi:hypothetical protein
MSSEAEEDFLEKCNAYSYDYANKAKSLWVLEVFEPFGGPLLASVEYDKG